MHRINQETCFALIYYKVIRFRITSLHFLAKNLIDECLNVFLKERINARAVIALRIYQKTNKNKNKTKNKMGKQVYGEGQTSISTIWSYFPITYACHLFFILSAQK